MYNYIQMSDLKFRRKGEEARGTLAARLRQRKFVLTKRYGIPEDLLPGSLSLTHSRCGRSEEHTSELQSR